MALAIGETACFTRLEALGSTTPIHRGHLCGSSSTVGNTSPTPAISWKKPRSPTRTASAVQGMVGAIWGTVRPILASSHEIRRFTVVSRRFSGGWRRPDPPSRWDMASGDGTFSIKGGRTYHGDRRGGGGMDSYPPDPRWGRGSSAIEVCAGVPGHGRVSSEWQWRDIRCTPAQYRDALARLDHQRTSIMPGGIGRVDALRVELFEF
jgi:hypothetical protein